MKLDGNTFKRLQYLINQLSAIKAHRHRRKGTTFTEEQLKYQLRKLKTDDLVDELFSDGLEINNSKPGEFIGKVKLCFEDVAEKIKNIRR